MHIGGLQALAPRRCMKLENCVSLIAEVVNRGGRNWIKLHYICTSEVKVMLSVMIRALPDVSTAGGHSPVGSEDLKKILMTRYRSGHHRAALKTRRRLVETALTLILFGNRKKNERTEDRARRAKD